LRHLGIRTPDTVQIEISEDFLRDNPDTYIALRHNRLLVKPGLHFGSQVPVTVVHDQLSDGALCRVTNLTDFIGVLAFDKWTGNTDARQAIFMESGSAEGNYRPRRVIASMIDNGYVFGG